MNKELNKIPTFSKYLITKDGRLYSLYKQRYMKPDTDKDGYLHFKLKNNTDAKYRHYYLHRLLALAFLDNELDDTMIVSFKDGNNKNFDLNNLEVCFK